MTGNMRASRRQGAVWIWGSVWSITCLMLCTGMAINAEGKGSVQVITIPTIITRSDAKTGVSLIVKSGNDFMMWRMADKNVPRVKGAISRILMDQSVLTWYIRTDTP